MFYRTSLKTKLLLMVCGTNYLEISLSIRDPPPHCYRQMCLISYFLISNNDIEHHHQSLISLIDHLCISGYHFALRKGNNSYRYRFFNRQTSGESASLPQYLGSIGKPRVSPLRFLNTSAVIRYLICVYASHCFAGRPYHFNQTLRTANKF